MPPSQTNSSNELKTDVTVWFTILSVWLIFSAITALFANSERIPYSKFLANLDAGQIQSVSVSTRELTGHYTAKGKRFVTLRVEDPELASRLAAKKIEFEGQPENEFLNALGTWIVPGIIFFSILSYIFGNVAKEKLGTGIMSIEKNGARVYKEEKVKISFKDVAGVDEAKEELQEIIGFLKDPQKYSRLGAHLPKGILLVGPPGTGKTLLARAVAGEAGVPFYSISGSEFVELFVGVGAARVRNLFSQAAKNTPCIVFIDELDAVGKARGLNAVGGHDEKEQTLNQLLVELDGFDCRQGLVLLAATNRPEILDAALLRAGRFDRHILVDRPDKLGRVEILKVHLREVSYEQSIKIQDIAALTPGFTGADLANLVNEAVLLATRRNADSVSMNDFNNALDRVLAGLEKKNRLLNVHEREVVAHHEMGHALVSMSLKNADPLQKVSIIPRGISALGYTIQRPTEDRFLLAKQELLDRLTTLLGGRAAEMLVFNEISTGAADDLSKATEIARTMVTLYGMSEELGPVSYSSGSSPLLGEMNTHNRDYYLSEATAYEIDKTVKALIENALTQALKILGEHLSILKSSAQQLLLAETLTQVELAAIKDSLLVETGKGDNSETKGAHSNAVTEVTNIGFKNQPFLEPSADKSTAKLHNATTSSA